MTGKGAVDSSQSGCGLLSFVLVPGGNPKQSARFIRDVVTKGGRHTLDRRLPCCRPAAECAVRRLRGHAAATARLSPHPADRLLLPRRLGRLEQHRPALARWITARTLSEPELWVSHGIEAAIGFGGRGLI